MAEMDILDQLRYFGGDLVGLDLNGDAREESLQFALENMLRLSGLIVQELREIRGRDDQD